MPNKREKRRSPFCFYLFTCTAVSLRKRKTTTDSNTVHLSHTKLFSAKLSQSTNLNTFLWFLKDRGFLFLYLYHAIIQYKLTRRQFFPMKRIPHSLSHKSLITTLIRGSQINLNLFYIYMRRFQRFSQGKSNEADN